MINIMDEYITFTKKSINDCMKLIFDRTHKRDLSDQYLNAYISTRYSNYLDDESSKLNLEKKIEKALDNVRKTLYISNPEEKELVQHYREFYSYVYDIDKLYMLEQTRNIVHQISQDREKSLELKNDNFESELLKNINEFIKKRKDFLDSFQSSDFNLDFGKLSDKNHLIVQLNNNIKFPELYSKKAIQKVREKAVISEDLAMITFLQVSAKVIDDMMKSDFDKKYYCYLPQTYFSKQGKLSRITSGIDNNFMLDHIILVINFVCFKRYRIYIMQLMRQGFYFALYLDDTFEYCTENLEYLELFENILIQSSKYYYKDMEKNAKINKRIISVNEVK